MVIISHSIYYICTQYSAVNQGRSNDSGAIYTVAQGVGHTWLSYGRAWAATFAPAT